MIPGMNILNTALTVIARQEALYHRAVSRGTNAIGQWVTTYAAPVPIRGSIQAVPRETYQNLGLDYQKNYLSCYFTGNVSGIQRGESGDQMTWNGRRYQFLSESEWYAMDGWNGLMAVEIGAAQ